MSESVAVGEIEARHGLIDDGDVGGVVVLVFIPNFALGDRDAKQREIIGADKIDVDSLVVARRLAEDVDMGLPSVGGGVALVEIAAIFTPGTVEALLSSASK